MIKLYRDVIAMVRREFGATNVHVERQNSGHPRIHYTIDGVEDFAVLSSTPSDDRSHHNMVRQAIQRKLRNGQRYQATEVPSTSGIHEAHKNEVARLRGATLNSGKDPLRHHLWEVTEGRRFVAYAPRQEAQLIARLLNEALQKSQGMVR